MIYAYTGRRSPSLPEGSRERVTERIRRLLAQSEPTAIVGSAACGADLIVLQAALALRSERGHPEIAVVMPTAHEVFREDSVEPEWRALFDEVIRRLSETDSIVRLGLEPGGDAYAAANLEILDRAEELASVAHGRFLVLAVASPGEGDAVEQMLDAAELRGGRALRIDPAVDLSQRPRCFVIMPYGRKLDPATKSEIDCDRTYGRLLVPALEHAQLLYRRADRTVDPGVVLRPMIDNIAHSDLVIADLATSNFNVGWELGLRHLFRAATTLLIKPAGPHPTPFDVQALRTVRYRADDLDDDAVLEAWEALEPFLALADDGGPAGASRVDSPVAATMDLTYASVAPIDPADDPSQVLAEQLARARELADPELVRPVIDGAARLPRERRLSLLSDAGGLLVRLGRFAEAREPLREVVEADPEIHRPVAHQLYAQSLYRAEGASADDQVRAERVLEALLERKVPETSALLGAIAKRRAGLLTGPARVAVLERAFDAYAVELRGDLNAFYPAVNVVSLGLLLGLVHGKADRLERAIRVRQVAVIGAENASERHPGDFWALASLAELQLAAFLTGEPGATIESVEAAYARASAIRPTPGELASAAGQLRWLAAMGLPPEPLERARAAVMSGVEADPIAREGTVSAPG